MEKEVFIYTPSALVNLFSNSMQFDAGKEMKRVKGKYVQGKDFLYGDKYYDTLKDETGESSMTLLVTGQIRSILENNQIIEVIGYLQKRVVNTGARIELQLVVTSVADQNKPTFNEAEVKAFEILQMKRDAGYLDVDGFIKTQILNEQKVNIKILVGKTGIIHSDIKEQLKDAIAFYDIEFIGINLSNENEIIDALQNTEADVIAIARGGGDRMEIFNKPEIAEAALTVNAYFITALGHAQDVPLLQKVADKAFTTPTALGQHLVDLYNNTIDERSKSKAGIVDAVTKSLKPLYEKQIENLKQEAANREKNLQNEVTNKEKNWLSEKQVFEERLKIAQEMQPQVKGTNWALVILLLIGGVALGAALYHFLIK